MQPPKLKYAFAGSSQKHQEYKPEPGLFAKFKAAAVTTILSAALALQAPDICEQLKIQKENLIAANSVNGTARDVRTHFALQTMILTTDKLIDGIHNGGAEGMEAASKAQSYLSRLQKLGLNA